MGRKVELLAAECVTGLPGLLLARGRGRRDVRRLGGEAWLLVGSPSSQSWSALHLFLE